jgi:hypothetical protein
MGSILRNSSEKVRKIGKNAQKNSKNPKNLGFFA